MVDKDALEKEELEEIESGLEFWANPHGIGAGFHDMRRLQLKNFGESSIALPKISLAWNFEMIWNEEELELPEC